MIRRFAMMAMLSAAFAVGPAAADTLPAARSMDTSEVVVLVHGMGRSPVSMAPLAWTLRRAGYEVINWGYSSTCCEIGELGARLERDLLDRAAEGPVRLHFVGHSLGNILVRWVLAHDEQGALEVGRIVMLAPPNQGSRVADRYARPLGWLLKPLPELRTAAITGSTELHLADRHEVGVIAGLYDRKVAVPETRIDGMDAHLVLPATHPFLMLRRDVHRLVLSFIQTGAFAPAPATPEPTSP